MRAWEVVLARNESTSKNRSRGIEWVAALMRSREERLLEDHSEPAVRRTGAEYVVGCGNHLERMVDAQKNRGREIRNGELRTRCRGLL